MKAADDFHNQVARSKAESLARYAVRCATLELDFTDGDLKKLVGADKVRALREGIDPDSNEGARALGLIVIARCLRSQFGAEDEARENRLHWMNTTNKAFGMSPRRLIMNNPQSGIKTVQDYCELMESKP